MVFQAMLSTSSRCCFLLVRDIAWLDVPGWLSRGLDGMETSKRGVRNKLSRDSHVWAASLPIVVMVKLNQQRQEDLPFARYAT